MKQLTFLTLIIFSLGAQAEDLSIKPGLWEIQNKMNVNGQEMPDMQKMLANVPPEMRAQMKAMMEQNGAGITDKGMTICITAEQIARGDMGQREPGSDCKMTEIKHSGDKTHMKMHCDAPHKADGTTEVTRISDTQWKSSTQMSSEKGIMKSEAAGKWLKSDCGNVKPAGKK